MTVSLKIVLLGILIVSACNEQEGIPETPNTQLEIDVINFALPSLIPENFPCGRVPIEGESRDDYDARLKAYHAYLDSLGKTIEIESRLKSLDSTYIQAFKTWDIYDSIPYLLNSQRSDRPIDTSLVKLQSDIKIDFVDSLAIKDKSEPDCTCLGRISFSRVGFNEDSTKAAFRYYIGKNRLHSHNTSGTGVLAVDLDQTKWQIINK